MDPEYDNVWSALDWSLTTAGDPEVALGLNRCLCELCAWRGMPREAMAALERALNHPRGVGRTAAHAAARADLARYQIGYGADTAAQHQLEQALSLARELGDRLLSAEVLAYFGVLARDQGDSATAWARLTESMAICLELGVWDAPGMITMASVAILEEDWVRAEALLADSEAAGQRVELHPQWRGWRLHHLGQASQLRGDYQRAAQLHQESLVVFRSLSHETDEHGGTCEAYLNLRETALGLGRLDAAARWLAQAVAASQRLHQSCLAWCLAGLGSAAALDAEPERPARLWGAAERLRQAIGRRSAPAARATYERAMAQARGQLGEDAFAAAWAAGQALTLEQAIAYALEVSAADAERPAHAVATT